MLPRTIIIARHICQKATKPTYCESSPCKIQVGKFTHKKRFLFAIIYIAVGLITRHLSLLEGNTTHSSQCIVLKPSVKEILSGKNYSSKKTDVTSNEKKAEAGPGISNTTTLTSINKESNDTSKTELTKGTPILQVIAPNLKEGIAKASEVKVNLENIKEQSLEKPIPITEMPIQQLKEKILDMKTKETETGTRKLTATS